MRALIAEDVLLLITDRRGSTRAVLEPRLPLAAGVLAELALDGHVALEPDRRPGSPRVVPVAGERPSDPILRDALAVVERRSSTASALIGAPLGEGLQDRLAERLAGQGVLRRRDHRVLGIVRWTWWPPASTMRADAVRADLRAALLGGAAPDARTTATIGILAAVEQVPSVLRLRGAEGRAAAGRARRLAAGDWVAGALRDASRAP